MYWNKVPDFIKYIPKSGFIGSPLHTMPNGNDLANLFIRKDISQKEYLLQTRITGKGVQTFSWTV